MPSRVELPGFLCQWLDTWGHGLWEDFLSGATASCPSLASNSSCVPSDLRVGTDCSGVDSPVHALSGMGFSFEHVFSCENAWAPRQVIAANTPPRQAFFFDVHSKDDVLPFVDLYVAGFSCKPFSMLHFGTKLLEEPEAEVFFSVLRRIKLLQPPAFVLENVSGISRCLDTVLALLKEMGYIVAAHCLNPIDLGEPVSRPRYYFIGAREDVALVGQEQVQNVYETLWAALKQSRAKRTSSTRAPSAPSLPLCFIAFSHRTMRRWSLTKGSSRKGGRKLLKQVSLTCAIETSGASFMKLGPKHVSLSYLKAILSCKSSLLTSFGYISLENEMAGGNSFAQLKTLPGLLPTFPKAWAECLAELMGLCQQSLLEGASLLLEQLDSLCPWRNYSCMPFHFIGWSFQMVCRMQTWKLWVAT